MGAEVWGPHFWKVLHLACFYKTATPEFVREFANALPCTSCRMHFNDLINDNPLPECTDSMFEWSVSIHNLVNARLGKPVISLQQATDLLQSKHSNTVDIKLVMLVVILVLLLVFFIVKK